MAIHSTMVVYRLPYVKYTAVQIKGCDVSGNQYPKRGIQKGTISELQILPLISQNPRGTIKSKSWLTETTRQTNLQMWQDVLMNISKLWFLAWLGTWNEWQNTILLLFHTMSGTNDYWLP